MENNNLNLDDLTMDAKRLVIEVAIFIGIVGAILGGAVSLISTNVQKMNTLDSKSE